MKAENFKGAFNSYEVGSKSLDDEGAVKEPLPFLKSIILLLDTCTGDGIES
jgi:hypothetical protein